MSAFKIFYDILDQMDNLEDRKGEAEIMVQEDPDERYSKTLIAVYVFGLMSIIFYHDENLLNVFY